MKKNFLWISFLFAWSFLASQEGIQFFNGSWDEALQQAIDEEKLIFVDAYTTWCGPCKRMANTVFTDPSVGAYFNETFINVKMDMESAPGFAFEESYPVSAYPTLFFIDDEGEVVLKVKGAKDVNGFLELGQQAMKAADFASRYDQKYEAGDRSPKLVYNYVKALNKGGKSSLKVVNDYVREKEALTSDEDMRIIFEGTTEADSRIFDLFIAHRARIEQLESVQAVEERIEQACYKTYEKAKEYRSAMLVEEAISKMSANYPALADDFAWKARKEFYALTRNAEAYEKTIKAYVAKSGKNDVHALHGLAQDILNHFSKEARLMKLAEKYSKKAANETGIFTYYLTDATLLRENGNPGKALEVAEMARKKAEGNKVAESQAIYFIESLEN